MNLILIIVGFVLLGYWGIYVGYNYRFTNLQASIAYSTFIKKDVSINACH